MITPEIMSTHSAQVLFSKTYSNKMNQGSLENWLILGLVQEIHIVNLEHLLVPESEEVLNIRTQ